MNDPGQAFMTFIVLFANQHTVTSHYDFYAGKCPFRVAGNVIGYADGMWPKCASLKVSAVALNCPRSCLQ